jgi:hypothetical protein
MTSTCRRPAACATSSRLLTISSSCCALLAVSSIVLVIKQIIVFFDVRARLLLMELFLLRSVTEILSNQTWFAFFDIYKRYSARWCTTLKVLSTLSNFSIILSSIYVKAAFYLKFVFVFFAKKIIGKKAAHKMLSKLTPG